MDLSYDTFQKEDTKKKGTDLSYDAFLQSKIPKESTFSKVKTAVTNYADESAKTVDTFNNAVAHPIETVKKLPSVFEEPYMKGINQAGEGLYGMFHEKGVANYIANNAKLISGLAGSLFSPITGLFHIAENTPGLKQVADTINIPFSASGAVGSFGTGKIIDWIPDKILSQESKDIIKKPLQEIGSLVAQIVIGGKIMDKVSSYSAKGESITPETASKIVEESKTEYKDQKLDTPEGRVAEANKTSGYEPYKSTEELPVPGETSKLSYDSFKKESDPLFQEASKYSTPDEFIKAQTNSYHGGDKVDIIDLNKSKFGKTFFVSDHPEYAKEYVGNGTLNNLHLSSDAKLIDIKNATPEQIQQIKSEIEKIKSEHVPYSGKGGFNPTFGNSTQELLDGAIRGKSHFAEDPALMEVYKKLGYDGMISYEDTGMRGKNIGVWNKDVIKTESDLKNIWNQAQKSKQTVTTPPMDTQGISQTSLKIRDLAVEKGITSDFPELAKIERMNMADQAVKANEFIDKNPREAMDIAMLKDIPKTDVRPESIFSALKEKAIKEGDVATIQELAKSKIGTEAGQSLKALDDTFKYGADPVSAVKAVTESRVKDIEKKDKIKVEKVLKEEKAKYKGPKSWSDFVDSLEC